MGENRYIRETDDQSEVSTTDSVRAVHNLAYLPKVEIDVFSGDPTKYHSFIAIFEQSVEKYTPDGGARLTRLLQYTDGIAKRAIQSYAIVGGDEGYEKARFILKQRFRDRHTISQALISVISSIYDPWALPVLLVIIGKIIFKDLTRLQLKWNESIPTHIQERWIEWLNELPMLEAMRIHRCLKPQIYNTCATTIQLHYFLDASQAAYGIITNIRIIDPSDHFHVTLLLSKSRLAPLKAMTIARLELIVAVLAASMEATLCSELDLNIQESFFWCDSQLVIQYIKKEKKRFHVFVANRVAAIQQASKPEQSRHIPGDMNPADDVTRGMRPKQFVQSIWL